MEAGAASGHILKTDLFEETQGDGLADALGRQGATVVGIDIAQGATVQASRRSKHVRAVRASVLAAPFSPESFDAVVSTSTLDHFVDPGDIGVALGEVSRVLRPGGVLYLTMDNPTNPLIRIRGGRLLGLLRRMRIVPYYVGVTLSARDLCTLLERCGYVVETVDHVMHFPRIVGVHAAGIVTRLRMRFVGRALLVLMRVWEHMPGRWVRSVTGHYSAIVARKREG
jgi:SAM-dependent methyltransferase